MLSLEEIRAKQMEEIKAKKFEESINVPDKDMANRYLEENKMHLKNFVVAWINEYIYKTNDFDSIQSRIDWFERELKRLKYELNKYKLNSQEYKECEYRIQKVQKEMDYNLKKINETIETMLLN